MSGGDRGVGLVVVLEAVNRGRCSGSVEVDSTEVVTSCSVVVGSSVVVGEVVVDSVVVGSSEVVVEVVIDVVVAVVVVLVDVVVGGTVVLETFVGFLSQTLRTACHRGNRGRTVVVSLAGEYMRVWG